MDLETVTYGYIPILIGLFEIIISIYLTKNRKKIFGFIVSFLIIVFNSFAIYILVKILLNSWPSYTPHILILLATILLIIQYLIFKKKKTICQQSTVAKNK
jgi:ABC-type uncharacterized transport system permease subunit